MISNWAFGTAKKKQKIRQYAYILKRMSAQNCTLSEQLKKNVEETIKSSESKWSQLLQKGLRICLLVGGSIMGNYLLTYIAGKIFWNYIKSYAIDCLVKFSILPFQMPLAVSFCNNGFVKLTGGILIGLALEEIVGFGLALWQNSKLDQLLRGYQAVIREQMDWLGSLISETIETHDQFFQHHRKIWKGESKINLDIKLMD